MPGIRSDNTLAERMKADRDCPEMLLARFLDDTDLFNLTIEDPYQEQNSLLKTLSIESPQSLEQPSSIVSLPSSPEASPGSESSRKRKQKNPVARHKRESHIKAELRRRSKIQHGFGDLKTLVPAIDDSPGSRESKSAMLFKAADYCRQLQAERIQMQNEGDALRAEIEMLTQQTSQLQALLPESGTDVGEECAKSSAVTSKSNLGAMYEEHVRRETYRSWKYWVYGMLMRPLFDSFNQTVSTKTWNEFRSSVMVWLQNHCSLGGMRAVALHTLRQLSTSTAVLTKPEDFPAECVRGALEEYAMSS
ncbi:carbohydrate-responsive element-binding protein [Lingula anatina]|uniref:Carbohydrate-responsive element-binding protein n=1 Tax=Lingula anatina TaxID=7574 RepID=A0A1S3JVB0_LINAN|nr:carbohydrate-responsive element-binding protein [Lingula anatina]|eukprot:XP_013414340.1 carbohydrate-responsive element-binding protein [Lingula anatina]